MKILTKPTQVGKAIAIGLVSGLFVTCMLSMYLVLADALPILSNKYPTGKEMESMIVETELKVKEVSGGNSEFYC